MHNSYGGSDLTVVSHRTYCNMQILHSLPYRMLSFILVCTKGKKIHEIFRL